MLLAKTKLNSIEILISKTLIDSYISHGETISINNVLQEYDEKKKKKKSTILTKNMFDVIKKNSNIKCLMFTKNKLNKNAKSMEKLIFILVVMITVLKRLQLMIKEN